MNDAGNVARAALARIESHERVCSERMKRIDERLAESQKDRANQRQEMRDGFAGVYRRLWLAAGGLILVLLGVVGFLANRAMVFH